MRTSSSVLVQLIKAEQRRANEVVLLWLLATIDDKYRRHTVCGAVLQVLAMWATKGNLNSCELLLMLRWSALVMDSTVCKQYSCELLLVLRASVQMLTRSAKQLWAIVGTASVGEDVDDERAKQL